MGKKTRGAIAAGHPKTAEAGQIIFELGGNAFDATLAAMLASFVVESTLTSAGGGGFLLAHTQEKENILFDFFSQSPLQKKPLDQIDFYPVDVNFGDAIQEFNIGLGSIAVPGNILGIFKIHQKLGTLPFSVIAEPAIHYAENGFIMTNFNEFSYRLLEPILLAYPESRKIYAPQGSLLKEGEICYNKDLAQSLRELAKNGLETFYQGEIAARMLKDLSVGGYLTQDDLSCYRVIERKPLKINYRGYELLTNPPPSSGGILITFALKLLEKIDLSKIKFGSPEHLNILIQVMELTNQARSQEYDNSLYQNNIAEIFLADELLKDYHQELSKTNKWGSTTHISVIDEDGNAASVTTSNGEGSSYVIPGTGIMLNNMLGEADLNPLGFHNWTCNQRISSMMSPTLILQEGQPKFVLGSGGANRIRTAILQVILNLLDFKFPLDEAVNHSRIHWENNILNIEPSSDRDLAINNLELSPSAKISLWQEQNMFFGGVHAVGITHTKKIEGVGDARRKGIALIENLE
ncbi:gamma-glutamyltransferase [Aphanothece hegewaldii CCALA 016]|uniref:Glutathione hydrolase proenzyme n=1 Tax=Aphanothece hegewaldii CCALA 016 TaxID=2107694 RepID=A0A2T1LXP8_9CHRO|nr:gamma-glutamyltransferase [Aphanothece hegewaldii]PSF37162.1 gamma-glutamyltransferase [Aphanothece hegewaldii CCALA 016]